MAATGVAPDRPGTVPQPSPRGVSGDPALEAAPEFDQIRSSSEILEGKNQRIFSFTFKAPVSLIPSESTFQKYLNKSDAKSAKESLNKAQWSLVRAIKQHELAKRNYESLVGGEDSVRAEELAELLPLERALMEAREERAQLQKNHGSLVQKEQKLQQELEGIYRELEGADDRDWHIRGSNTLRRSAPSCNVSNLKVREHQVKFQLDRARLRTEAVKDKTAEIEVLEAKLRDKKLPLIIAPNDIQSDRIVPFHGSTKEDFNRGGDAIVSFPGGD